MNKNTRQTIFILPKLFFLASSAFSQVFAIPLLDVVISKHEKIPIGSDGKFIVFTLWKQFKRSSPH